MFTLHPVLMFIIFMLGVFCLFLLKQIDDMEEDKKRIQQIFRDSEDHVINLIEENRQLKRRLKENDPDFTD